MTSSISKRLDVLEAGKERVEFEPLHLYMFGAEKVPDRKYYVGEDPFVIVHEAPEAEW
jgi:hypothetical protein